MGVSEWLPVNVGLRQGCVYCISLLNVYMAGVVRDLDTMVLGRGVEQLHANGGRFEIKPLLFTDGTALAVDS